MRPGVIRTENVTKGLYALAELKRRYGQASKRNALIIEGLTGRGKTRFSEWAYTQNQEMAYVEADPDWSAAWLMEDVALALNISVRHSIKLNKRGIVETSRRELRLLIIDEANRILRSERLLDTVRGLLDAGLPLILVGETGLWDSVYRKSQRFADRIGQVVVFGDVSAADIEQAALELADLKFPRVQARPDQPAPLAAYLQERAAGNFRRAAKIIEELEAVCKANPGEITRQRVDLAIQNLLMKEEREQKRAPKRAAAGAGG